MPAHTGVPAIRTNELAVHSSLFSWARYAVMSDTAAQPRGTATPQELELAQLIVQALNLEMAAEEIDPDAPLYGEGLGLDSIDILEIALVISKSYGVKVRSDDQNNSRIFSSLRTLNGYIQEQRAA